MSFTRGGRGGRGLQRNLPFGLDYGDISNQPASSDSPQISLPVNGVSTKLEKVIASHFISFQAAVKDGPFFTGSNLDVESIKKNKAEIDEDGINDGLKRYSDRYIKKRKIGSSIDDHPYNIEFFPTELYKAMGVDDKKKKKLLSLSKLKNSREVLQKMDDDNIETTMLEKLKELAETEEEKEEPEPEVDDDDEFEEEDDDDYNAEKYFDDGEDFGDEDDFNDHEAEF